MEPYDSPVASSSKSSPDSPFPTKNQRNTSEEQRSTLEIGAETSEDCYIKGRGA